MNAGYGGEVDWLGAARLALAFTVGLLAWTLCLSMLALALSAWVKWRPAATLGLLGAYIVTTTLGDVLQSVLGGALGKLPRPGRCGPGHLNDALGRR